MATVTGSTSLAVTAATDVFPAPPGRVLIALNDGPLVWNPTWTPFDDLSSCRCSGFDISRGRQSELDTTDTGTARVYWRDRNQTTNDVDLVGRQIMLQVWNPVTRDWVPQFRGVIDEPTFDVNPAGVMSEVQFNCVDLFDFLGGVEMELEDFGDPPPDQAAGSVFYDDEPVDQRLEALLNDAGLSPDWYILFSGNVEVWDTFYDPGDSILAACRDAADAEFPGIANIYVDKRGRFVFHGRFARFDPEGTKASASPRPWDFTRWQAATREDVTGSAAQIRTFSYGYPRSRIINSYIAWPRYDINGKQFPEEEKKNQRRSDLTSIARHGRRGRSAQDLIIKRLKPAVGTSTGAEQCQFFADFYVNNYKDPRTNVQTVTFKSLDPGDSRAAANWAAMLGIDISDGMQLTIDEAGIAAQDFFVEGVSMEVRPANPEYDAVTVTPNLTPAAYYTDNPFD